MEINLTPAGEPEPAHACGDDLGEVHPGDAGHSVTHHHIVELKSVQSGRRSVCLLTNIIGATLVSSTLFMAAAQILIFSSLSVKESLFSSKFPGWTWYLEDG